MKQATDISARAWAELLLLGLIWGASFLSIRIALDEVSVLSSVCHRVGWAALVLWAVVLIRGEAVPRSARLWGSFAVMGLLNNVLPFTLMAWGQLSIESGLTSILNAFTAVAGVIVAALVFADERLTARRLAGVALGFAGVTLCVGPALLAGFSLRSAAQLAVLAGTLCYALAGAWARVRLKRLSPLVAAAGMLTCSTLMMLPLTLVLEGDIDLPATATGAAAIGYYALIATACAYLLYYRVLAMAGAGAIWDTLQSGQVIEATCVGTNKGGLEMELAGGHRAFLPASQVAIERVNDLDKFIGQKLECEVQRVERRGQGNVVLSRRVILEKERAKEAEKLKDTLAVGQVVEGTVQRIAPFGAFVDIGGIDGLVHVSDLSHERIGQGEAAVRKMVSEGQQVRVEILKLDWENQRIGLGMKQLQADPYAEKMGAIEEGAEVSGRVTKIMDFGAFVELAPGVEGLIHISELDHKRVKAVSDAVKPDEVVNVKVLSVDPGSRRIGLSMKALKPAPAGAKGKGERGPSADEILKETPQLRRLREKFGSGGFKGGLG